MKKIYIHMMMLAAMVVAGAAMTSCQKEEAVTGKFTMSVKATKGGGNAKALSEGEHTINATWAVGERVTVYNITKGEPLEGYLEAQSAGASTTLNGTLTGTIAVDDELTLKFNENPNYSSQDGTLAYIAAHCDYAEARVKVSDNSGSNIRITAAANFVNQQAIVKFTLLNKANSAAISPSALTVTDGTHTVSLTDIPNDTYTTNGASNVLFVAFPAAGSAKTITLTATVGSDTYTYTTASASTASAVTFDNGQYYEITVKMTKQAPALNLTSPAVGQVIGDDGKNYNYASLPDGVTAVAKICYVSGSNGLALALADEGQMIWSTAISTCAAHTPAFTGGTWKLATKDEWNNMITAAGSYTALRDGFSSVGGSNLQSGSYWTSTEDDSENDDSYHAWSYNFGSGMWWSDHKYYDGVIWVRACLAF